MFSRSQGYKLAVVGLLVGGIVLATTGCGATAASAAQVGVDARRSITVVGSGQASAKPDVANTQIGVDIRDANAQTASSQANDRVNAIIAAMKGLGIEDKDIQTANFNIWVEQPYGDKGEPSGAPVYHAVNTLNVTVRDLSKVGQVLDAALEAGANTVSGVSFSVSDPAAMESEARAKAVANAKTRAADLAKEAGVQAGEILVISEVIGQQPIPMVERAAMADGKGGGASIQPGELQTNVQVQVTFAIQ